MGKLFVKLGNWITKMWCKYCCLYNSIIVKLIIKVDSCPNQICVCKK
jgi:hypothetical protein